MFKFLPCKITMMYIHYNISFIYMKIILILVLSDFKSFLNNLEPLWGPWLLGLKSQSKIYTFLKIKFNMSALDMEDDQCHLDLFCLPNLI